MFKKIFSLTLIALMLFTCLASINANSVYYNNVGNETVIISKEITVEPYSNRLVEYNATFVTLNKISYLPFIDMYCPALDQHCYIKDFRNFMTYPEWYTLYIDIKPIEPKEPRMNNKPLELAFKFPDFDNVWMKEHKLHEWGVE